MKSLKDRFLSKVHKTETCWLWTGSKVEAGYGKIRTTTSKFDTPAFAHRVSFELFIGPIPEGYLVCHKCDVTCCVNPEHLFLGTHKENVADMIFKGRKAKGYKLTPIDVMSIKQNLTETTKTQTQIAEDFNISQAMVWRISKGLCWQEVSNLPS